MHHPTNLPDPAPSSLHGKAPARWAGAGLLLVALATVPPAEAVVFRSAGDYRLAAGEIESEELWIRAGQVDIAGTLNNQLFAAATNLVLNGTFRDDVWAASSGPALFEGTAENHLRLAAATALHLRGTVGDSALLAASTVKLDPEAVVGADALLVGEDVITEASVHGDLRLYASKATLGGHIAGSVRILAEDIVVLPDTVIEGDLVYTMSKELVLSRQVQLKGELRREGLEDLLPESKPRSAASTALLQAFFFVNAFLSGMMFLLFMPRFLAHAAARVRLSPARCMLTGSLAFLLLPFIIQSLLLNKVTLIVGAITGLTYATNLYLAKTVPALLLGGLLLRIRGPQPMPRIILTLLTGMAVLYLLMTAPLFGALVWVAATCLGLGAILNALWDTQIRAVPPPPIPKPPLLAEQHKEVHTNHPSNRSV